MQMGRAGKKGRGKRGDRAARLSPRSLAVRGKAVPRRGCAEGLKGPAQATVKPGLFAGEHQRVAGDGQFLVGGDDPDLDLAVRRGDLLRAFGSVKNIKRQSVQEMSKVVPKNIAEAVFNYFNS